MENIQDYEQAKEQFQVIKPSIKMLLILFQSFIRTIVVFFFIGWFGSGFLSIIFTLLGMSGVLATLMSAALLFLIILIIVYLYRKATLNRTQYKFYNNRVEYYEGFLVKNRKTINYDRITNIGQRKGIVEGMLGLGTIFIDTAGSSQKGHELAMSYLEHPDQIYDWITKLTAQRQ
jgi:membrane protein YdbS with pleckstrin-like domain